MPVLRRYLHWMTIALLAIFAPIFAAAVFVAERFRTRRRSKKAAPGAGPTSTVLAFLPKSPSTASRSDPPGGAVVIPFPTRGEVRPSPNPPALTG